MKQKNLLKIAMLFVFTMIANFSYGQILTETFDNKTQFTSSEGFFSDGSGDYFGIYDPVGSTDDFGAGSQPSSIPAFTGNNGNFLVGEDLDGDGTAATQTLTWENLNINGFTGLNFSVKLGASSGFDAADQITLSVNIDGAGYSDVSSFSVASGSNQFPTDGITTLGLAMQTITGNISGTGASMDLRFTVTANSGSEEFAVDDLLINGTASSDPTIGFDNATSSQNETDATFSVNIPVTVSNYDGNQIDMNVAVTGGTAEVADYTLNTSSLSFNADGSQNVSLDIIPDTEDFDDEEIIITITETSSVSGLIVSKNTHTITVTDDDTPPSIGFDSATSSENETDITFTSANIPITVANYSGTQIDINVSVTGGTAEIGDYTFTSPTALSFSADGTQNITVDINDDADTDEETIIFTITETSSVTGLVISESTHTLTITDDEIPPLPTAGTVFITEVVDAENFNYDYLELFNNSNETVSLNTSKLVRASATDNSSEYVFDFGTDESTANTDVTIPAYGFLIITRGGTRADFNTDFGITLDAGVNFNGGNTNLFFGNSRRWRLRVGGTANTDDGTLVDDTGAGVGSDKDYRNIFTDNFISGTLADATPGALEYLVYSGGAWVNSVAMDATTAAKDAYIYDDLTMSSDSEINDLGITSGGSLTINSGTSLLVNGTSSGNVTYNRTLGTENWYLVSSPVAGETYDDAYVATNSLAINGTNNAIATYNDADASGSKWSYMQTGGGANFTAGTGYSVRRETAAGAGDISFTGTINTSDVSLTVVTAANGFNLIGNPYTSHLNSATFLTDNTGNLISETIWVFDQSSGNYETKVTGDSFVLAPAQGFFVRASATSLNIAESYQATTGGTFQKSAKTEVRLMMTDGTANRFAKVYYLDNATTSFDNGYDGETFGGISNSIDVYTQLLSNDAGKKYQIQSLPNSDFETMVIPVGLKVEANKEITFSAEALNLPTDINVYLEDRLTNTFTRLDEANSSYKVTSEVALDGIGRFYLHTKASSALSVDSLNMENISIYKTNNSNLRIAGLSQGEANIKIYTILGKEVLNKSFTSNGVQDIRLPSLSSGIYIVQLETETGSLNKKITLE